MIDSPGIFLSGQIGESRSNTGGRAALLSSLGDKLLTEPKGMKRSLAEPELFNLAADYEQPNLAKDQPDKFQELAMLLAKYREQGYSRPGWHPAN